MTCGAVVVLAGGGGVCAYVFVHVGVGACVCAFTCLAVHACFPLFDFEG